MKHKDNLLSKEKSLKQIKKRRNQFRTRIFSKGLNEIIWKRDKFRCHYCHCQIFPYSLYWEWEQSIMQTYFDAFENGEISYEEYLGFIDDDRLSSIWKKYHKYDLATIDHLVPMSKGGSDELENLVSCCRRCNSKKNNKETLLSV